MSFEKCSKLVTENLIKNDKITSQLEIKSEFEILSLLGRGVLGQVSLVKHMKSGVK
jgi:hypothetical protein